MASISNIAKCKEKPFRRFRYQTYRQENIGAHNVLTKSVRPSCFEMILRGEIFAKNQRPKGGLPS